TNPWGVTYDDWGNHVASHPVFATAFHATNPPYPKQHPKATGMQAYSGTCGQEFVDFPSWPKEMQGGFVKVRYKPTNRVEIHNWVEKDDHFEEAYVGDLIFSTNLSFIPVDLRFGPRGAMYVCDWYNPIKGHAQYSLRDERRDRTSGRIWRILPKGAQLQKPPAIAQQSTPALLDILKRPEYRYRYWAKRELREKDAAEVKQALDTFVAQLDKNDARYRHHQVEAFWAYRNVGASNPDLLEELLTCDEHHARAAATRQLRYASGELPNAMALLNKSANDTNGLVRMEAIIAASYIGTRESVEAAVDVLKHPSEVYLKYAIQTALGSAAVSQHLDAAMHAAHPELKSFGAAYAKTAKLMAGITTRDAKDSNFDSQKDLSVVEISCIPERLMYTKTRFTVKPGQPVKLIFTNPDVTQHNLLIVEPGALEEIGIAGNMMAKDPSGIKKGFIPESNKILHHTKLLEQDTGEVLRFNAPKKPGKYPYLCTFPGHWVIMQGIMIVTP
ncbi:MAG: azurin, partial [Kiritimatiellia bacterium]